MPNRVIRESALTSATLYLLSDGGERFFWRLTLVADDFGRFEANARVLKSRCFPLWPDERRSAEEVAALYAELVEADLVRTYAIGGKTYGYFVTWHRHQRKRKDRASKFPEPTEDAMCGQLPPLAAVGRQVPPLAAVGGLTRDTRHETRDVLQDPPAGQVGATPPSGAARRRPPTRIGAPGPEPEAVEGRIDHPVHACIRYWADTWTAQVGGGKPPIIRWAASTKLLKGIVAAEGEDGTRRLIDQLFRSTDRLISRSDRGLGVFSSQVNKLKGELAQAGGFSPAAARIVAHEDEAVRLAMAMAKERGL